MLFFKCDAFIIARVVLSQILLIGCKILIIYFTYEKFFVYKKVFVLSGSCFNLNLFQAFSLQDFVFTKSLILYNVFRPVYDNIDSIQKNGKKIKLTNSHSFILIANIF